MKLGKESNYFLNICSDFQNISISTNKNNIFENEIFSFSKEDLDYNSYFDVDRLPTLNINFENMPIKYENIDFSGSIDNINDFLISSIENFPKNEALLKEYLNNKTFIRWNFYIYYISLKILVIVSLHPNFSYSEETGEELNVFFDSINLVKSNFKTFLKIYKDGYLIPKISNEKISTNEYELVKLLKKYSKVISDNIIISNDDSNKIDFKKDSSIQNNILSENLENNIIIQSENNKKVNIFSQKNNNSNFKYNIQENDRVQLFIQNSKYSEMKNCTEGKFDSISFFENHFDLIPFIDFISNKDKFLNIIQNYHNFLLLIIMLNMEDEEQENQLNHIFNFMPVFEILYKLNEILQLVDYTEFYNEYINKNVEVNFENECKYYLKYLEKDDKTKFCWLRYYWIFNAKSKSEILCEFNLKTKRDEFFNHYSNLNHPLLNNQNIGNALLIIEIKRNNMIEDSLNFLVNSQLNYKKHLKVKFKGEEGIDEGGVKKEYFLILVRQLFNPNYGMFTFSQKTRLFWFNPISFEAKIKFELIGIIFGLAFFNNVILDIKFPLVIYKKLLNIKPTLQDLKQIDAELYTNFNFLLNTKEKNLEELLGTTFTAIVDSYGEKQIIPLKPDGENIYINEDNRYEYIELYLDWYFNKSIEEVFNPFKIGFYRILKPDELELIICGSQILNFVELEQAAVYQDGYEEKSETIILFWKVVHEFSNEEKKKFLSFLTGCDRAPLDGLGSLVITITKFGPDSDKLPCAHTCFNHLMLPDYLNIDKLRNRLLIAINHFEGFGLL